MSIEYKPGQNIFDSGADAIVVTVNCVGAMGKGLAKQAAIRYPDMERRYKAVCAEGVFYPGEVIPWHVQTKDEDRWILNLATKAHYRNPSQIQWIIKGMRTLGDLALHWRLMANKELESIAIPPIGCGEGGLNWDDVRPFVVTTAGLFQMIRWEIYGSA